MNKNKTYFVCECAYDSPYGSMGKILAVYRGLGGERLLALWQRKMENKYPGGWVRYGWYIGRFGIYTEFWPREGK